MVKKATDAINEFKQWLFIPMGLLIVFFTNKFYEKQDKVIDTVQEIKLEVYSYKLEIKTVKEQQDDLKMFLTKEFYTWQLEKHSTKTDSLDNEEDY